MGVISLFLYSIFFIFYFLRGIYLLDPDFGWHIRMGQIILQSGVPKTDTFSYTMAHYPMVDHEWLTNVLIALAYPYVGKLGLAIFFSCLAISAIFLMARLVPKHMRQWMLIPLFFTGLIFINFVGVRTQVITWFFLAVFFTISSLPRLGKYRVILYPLLFFLWVNLHGAFATGIVLLIIMFIAKMLEDGVTFRLPLKKHHTIKRLFQALRRAEMTIHVSFEKLLQGRSIEFLTVLLSILATFVNPYGPRIWWEVWMQITDQNLRWTISEWIPPIVFTDFLFWAFFACSLVLLFWFRREYTLTEKMLFFTLLYGALSSVRHIPLLIIYSLPLIARAFYYLSQRAAKVPFGTMRFRKAYWSFFGICCLLFSYTLYNQYFTFRSSQEQSFFPIQALEYLRKYPPKENILSPYEWNGYIVWKMPGRRVFIDGMMPSWRDHEWEGESRYAFKEYNDLQMNRNSPLKRLSEKYKIDTLLWYNKDEKNLFKGQVVDQAESLGWEKVYGDKKSVIYQKKQ